MRGLVLKQTAKGEFTVDMFAGGGGTSKGIEGALGEPVDIAINHDADAIAIHKANHPKTYHFLTDVREVNPREVLAEREVGLLWLSPDCTHHSRAKGGKPVKRNRRALANVGIVWAQTRRPRVILLENVEEFEGWGPLGDDGLPDKTKKGQSFRRWVKKLERLGYNVQYRTLVAADYGAPTIRKRLFLVARRDGRPIVWPAASHAPASKATLLGLKPWRAAYECIDWSIPGKSIFERKKPLAEATMRRIHAGIFKFVFGGDPFIVSTNHGSGPEFRFRGQSIEEPLNTITAHRDMGSLVTPSLIQMGYGENKGQAPRLLDGEKPLGTIVGGGKKHGLSTANLVEIGNNRGTNRTAWDAKQPANTILTENRHALIEHFLVKFKGKQGPKDIKKPLDGMTTKPSDALGAAYLTKLSQRTPIRDVKEPHTAVTSGNRELLTLAHLAKNFTGVVGSDMRQPKGTVTARDHDSLITSHLDTMRGTSKAGRSMKEPVPGLTAGGKHVGAVTAFLVKYFRTGVARSVRRPAPTLTSKHRMGLVTVQDIEYQIVDICLRMLTPMELLRAQFGKYAEGYILLGNQEKQVKAIGNSVPPEVAEALVKANYRPNEEPLLAV